MIHLRNLQNEARKITLSPREKDLLRSQIFAEPTVAAGYAVSHFHFFSVRFIPALAAVLIVMLGSGTTYAAQGALPGDLLYPVKISVNERVEVALARTPEKKIEAEVRLAERRVAEAEALEVEGRLDVETVAALELQFDKHVSNALALAEERADESEQVAEQGDESMETSVVFDTSATATEDVSGDTGTTMTMSLMAPAGEASSTVELETSVSKRAATATLKATTSAALSTSTKGEEQKWSRSELYKSLEERRNTWREFYERAERRDRSEGPDDRNEFESEDEAVKGEQIERDEEEHKGKGEDSVDDSEDDKEEDNNTDERDDDHSSSSVKVETRLGL